MMLLILLIHLNTSNVNVNLLSYSLLISTISNLNTSNVNVNPSNPQVIEIKLLF